MINHYELRHQSDYIAKLREDRATGQCIEVVFYKGEEIHRAEFPAANLGSARRSEYLECMAASVAREHARKGVANV